MNLPDWHATTLTGNVTTTGAQSYGEAVTLAATSTLATTNANISFGNTISGSSFGLTLGAGTTLTKEAPAGELTLSRAKQITIPGWKRPVKTSKK